MPSDFKLPAEICADDDDDDTSRTIEKYVLNKNAVSPWQIETAQEHYGAVFKENALTIFKVPLSLKYIFVQEALQV